MDEVYDELASTIYSAALQKKPYRFIVGIAGPPGSGKSTVAEAVTKRINENQPTGASFRAQTVSMDGFHYPRRYLDSLPNKEEAYTHRGAPWTFDVEAMAEFVARLHKTAMRPSQERPNIYAPSFDHAAKDPRENDVEIMQDTSILILDGNYLLLNEDKWKQISECLDIKLFVEVDPEVARERVARRHVASGIEPTLEKGLARFDTNDRINGDLIREKVLPFDLSIQSR